MFLNSVDAERFFSGFCNNPFVTFAVDHNLPTASTHRLATFFEAFTFVALLLPNGEAPFLEVVHGIIHVTANIVNKIFTSDTHEISTHHAHIICGIVVAHVGIDRGQTLSHRAGAIYGGFIDQLDFDVVPIGLGLFDPRAKLEGSATTDHAATDKEDINVLFDYLRVSEFAHVCS